MRKIIGFRTLCVSLGIWVGTLVVSAQGEFKALPWRQSTAYNSYLMRDVHRQFADRQFAIQKAFASPAGMQKYLEGCRERYKQIVGTFPEKGSLNAQVVGKVQGTGYHIVKASPAAMSQHIFICQRTRLFLFRRHWNFADMD